MTNLEIWFRVGGGIISVLGLSICGEYLLKFRPGLSEKYRMKSDCETILRDLKADSEQLRKDNREDHKGIYSQLEQVNKKLFKVILGIQKLNGGNLDN